MKSELKQLKSLCNGIKTSGYWKGYKCNAIGKYEVDGKKYCANHLPAAQKRHDAMIKDIKETF
jgi:hypothetical protein